MSGGSTGVGLLIARSAVHVGTGEASGSIDRPIMREHNTRLPMIPASTVKGAMRDACRPDSEIEKALMAWRDLFGPERDLGEPGTAAIFQPEDARLVVMPVPASGLAFAWVTSPYLLLRLAQACQEAGITLPAGGDVPVPQAGKVLRALAHGAQSVSIADLTFGADSDPARQSLTQAWADWLAGLIFDATWHDAVGWRQMFRHQFTIVSNTVMHHLSLSGTEVRPRISRNDDGTVSAKALWFEELLPEYAVLSCEWSLQPLAHARVLKPAHMGVAQKWAAGETDALGVGPVPGRLRLGGLQGTGKGRLAWALVRDAAA